ncbi:MAG: PEP-utilizing enzyme [Candidatus Magasanikbacteria bacterium]|nr:PEP-utilizing enzyme [Candidatus Magasanikbacteria bacterium]
MINFRRKQYQLFFSNNLAPLVALNYADELFFKWFKKYVGAQYRILSIIKNGWQEKYGLVDDINNLKSVYQNKLRSKTWIKIIFVEYKARSKKLKKFLDQIARVKYNKSNSREAGRDLVKIRELAAPLDAMSNLLHLFSELVGGINSKPTNNLNKIIQVGAYIKEDVSKLLARRRNNCNNLFGAIAKILRLRANDIEYLTIPEIILGLRRGKIAGRLINARKKITILFYEEKKLKIYAGKAALQFLKRGRFKELLVSNSNNTLRGQIARRGVAAGRVIVVKNSTAAIRRMKRGDILVAPYTAVEYLPAIKLAAALVTETGGLTSHAAIVARELGTPCIIGVRDVTKLLKTGDLVEVNADIGVIIKK